MYSRDSKRGSKASVITRRCARRGEKASETLPYMPGLDGLRALAVVAVLLYHAGLAWIPGGFLGVDVFFVISGYLITSLLLAEWAARGRVDLMAFWLGRARRLLPAAFLVIAASLAFAVVFLPGEVAGLRGDALASFGYVTNWYLIFEHESYFEAVGRPSLLRHLWSLAVEEQFYLLWPPLLAAGFGMGALFYRRRRLLVAVLAGAAGSALLMAALYQPEVDPSRVYYGTDTRAAGLLVGAALAFFWAPGGAPRRALERPLEALEETGGGTYRLFRSWRFGWFRRGWGWTAPLLLDALGLAALAGLVWSCLTLGEYQPFLYRGGFALVAVATAVLIAAVVYPRGHLGARLLSWGPLRWVGLRSYGIYLWHWPVFMASRPHLDVPLDGAPLLLGRLAVTVVLADLSYRYVETPIRGGALGRAFEALREARGARRWRLGAQWAGASVSVLACSTALGLAVAHAQPPEPPSYLSKPAVHVETPASEPANTRAEGDRAQAVAPATAPPPAASEEQAYSAAGEGETGGEERGGTAASTGETAATASYAGAGTPALATAPSATAIGDSVMIGGVDALQQEVPSLTVIDARMNRQAPEAIALLGQLRASGELGDVVVVHIGNNGVFTAEDFDEMMVVLSGVKRVLVVNTTVPDGYGWAPNNEVLAAGVLRHPDKAVLVDWHAASAGHPEYFWDGLHLTPQGASAYAGLISVAYEEENWR